MVVAPSYSSRASELDRTRVRRTSFVGDDGPCGVVLADRLPPALGAPGAGPRTLVRPATAGSPAESLSALVVTPFEMGTKRLVVVSCWPLPPTTTGRVVLAPFGVTSASAGAPDVVVVAFFCAAGASHAAVDSSSWLSDRRSLLSISDLVSADHSDVAASAPRGSRRDGGAS